MDMLERKDLRCYVYTYMKVQLRVTRRAPWGALIQVDSVSRGMFEFPLFIMFGSRMNSLTFWLNAQHVRVSCKFSISP